MRTHAMTRSLLCLCLLALAACDAPGEAPEQASLPTAAGNADSRRTAVETAAALAAADAAGALRALRDFGTCHAGCYDGRSSATNRETCKLTCEGAAQTAADALGASHKHALTQAVARLRGCIDQCREDPALSVDNRETCILTCSDGAEVALTGR